jgi:hypothetical protein
MRRFTAFPLGKGLVSLAFALGGIVAETPARRMSGRAVGLLGALFVLATSVMAQSPRDEPTEASVKAAFLYKFAAYVEWPARAAPADSPFVIGVTDDNAVASELEKIVPGRAIAGHPIVVRRVRRGEAPGELQAFFAGGDDPDRAAIRSAQKQGALVVTECRDWLGAGSAINFVVAADHVGFEISLEGADRSGLRISSRMLAVARRVVQKGD